MLTVQSVCCCIADLQVVQVSVNGTLLDQLCTAKTLAAYLADTYPVTTVTSTMQTVMCSITTELPEAFRQFVDYESISTQVTRTDRQFVEYQSILTDGQFVAVHFD